MGLTIHFDLKTRARKVETIKQKIESLRQFALDLPVLKVSKTLHLVGEEACCWGNLDQDDPLRWLLIQAEKSVKTYQDKYSKATGWTTVTPLEIVVLSVWPGEGCEEINLGLARYPHETVYREPGPFGNDRIIQTNLKGWSWKSFCKTQYASNPECGGVENFVKCHLACCALLDKAKELGLIQKPDAVTDEGEFWENRDLEALVEEVGSWNEMIADMHERFKESGIEMESAINQYPNVQELAQKYRASASSTTIDQSRSLLEFLKLYQLNADSNSTPN